MQRISKIILQASLALGVLTIALPSVTAIQERNECLDASRAQTSAQPSTGTVNSRNVHDLTDAELLAAVDGLHTAPRSCRDLSDIWFYGVLAVVVFLTVFISAHICWLVGRAYKKTMSKLA
ncbi:hypothetical protein [Caballeronia sp. HLA56]